VDQEHRRIGHECARDRAALAHAAGELVRIVAPEPCQTHEPQRRLDPLVRLGFGNAARHQAEADVGLDAHPREQPALLEHHGVLHAPAAGLDRDRARRLMVEPGEDAQQRRLAAAGRPDDAEELARLDPQVDAVERAYPALAAHVFLAQAGDADRSATPLNDHARPPPSPTHHPTLLVLLYTPYYT